MITTDRCHIEESDAGQGAVTVTFFYSDNTNFTTELDGLTFQDPATDDGASLQAAIRATVAGPDGPNMTMLFI